MEVLITEDLIESVLPNSLVAVDDESPLSARVASYAADACRWLENRLVGDLSLPPDLAPMAEKAVTIRALIMALPALDVVATPTGFGVVSSNSLAPASKDRVHALAKSLDDSLCDVVAALQRKLLALKDWRESAVGAAFCSSCLCRISDAELFASEMKDVTDLFDRFAKVSSLSSLFESVLAENYIGHPLMRRLRSSMADGSLPEIHPVMLALRNAESMYVGRMLGEGAPARCPDPHYVWHLARPVILQLQNCPDLNDMYVEHLEAANPQDFKNYRRGGYFF